MGADEAPVDTLLADTIGGEQALSLWRAPRARAPLVAVLPAMGIRASYYAGLAEALRARGLSVLLADFPGHGDSPVRARRGLDWSYGDLVGRHAPAIRAAGRRALPHAPFVWLGHSLGGQVALMDAGLSREVSAVGLVASGSPYVHNWSGGRRLYMRFALRSCALLARGLGRFPGERVGFGGREAKSLILEWARAGATGRYAFVGLDGDDALCRWAGPTLAIELAGDDYAPRSAMEHTLAKTRAEPEWVRWEPDPGLDLDHNRWPRAPEQPAERIAAWLATALG